MCVCSMRHRRSRRPGRGTGFVQNAQHMPKPAVYNALQTASGRLLAARAQLADAASLPRSFGK
jgi:hypothetical protein